MWRRVMLVLVAATVWSSAGCGKISAGGGAKKTADASDESSPGAGKKELLTEDDRKVGDVERVIGRLDEDRVEVSLPKGWLLPASFDKKYLSMMRMSQTVPLPVILFYASDSSSKRDRVTTSNVEDFAEERQAALKKESSRIEVTPVTVKSFSGIEYVRSNPVKGRKSTVSRLLLETVVDKRLYTVELRTPEGMTGKYRDAAYAVATSLKFPKAKNAAKNTDADAKSDDKKPGDKKPDDKKKSAAKAGGK